MNFDKQNKVRDDLIDGIFGKGASAELTGHFREYANAANEITDPEYTRKDGGYDVALADINDTVAGLTPVQKLGVLTGAILGVAKDGSPAVKQRAVETVETLLSEIVNEIVTSIGDTALMSAADFKANMVGASLKRYSRGGLRCGRDPGLSIGQTPVA